MDDESFREFAIEFNGIWARPKHIAGFAEKLRIGELTVEQIDTLLGRVPPIRTGTTGEVCAQLTKILERAREHVIRTKSEGINLQRNESRERILFISCGQCTEQEKELGRDIAQLVRDETTLTPYFAQDVSSLEGLTRSIFTKLDEAVGLICVMHKRGKIHTPEDRTVTRASVWIEQELAIASFLNQISGRSITVLAFCEEGVSREGLRQYLHLNPTEFIDNCEVLSKLREELHTLDAALESNPKEWDLIEIRAPSPLDHPGVQNAVNELDRRGITCRWKFEDELVGTGDWSYVELDGNRVFTHALRNQRRRDGPPEFLVYQDTEDK